MTGHHRAEGAQGLVRYCPECGHVGAVSMEARDCCPDGSRARMVPLKAAEQARVGFILGLVMSGLEDSHYANELAGALSRGVT